MDYCKHGMISESCSICSGLVERKQAEYDINEEKRKEEKRKQSSTYYQEESKKFADRADDPVEDWELIRFLECTDSGEFDKRCIFDLAKEFKRTYQAVTWMYRKAYQEHLYAPEHRNHPTTRRFNEIRATLSY